MEKKEIKISLGTFVCMIIIAILVVALIIMGMYIFNFNEPNKTISNNNSETTNNDLEKNKATSIIIGDNENYFAAEGYGADRILKEDFDFGYVTEKERNKYHNKNYTVYTKNKCLGTTRVQAIDGDYAEEIYLKYEIEGRAYDYKGQNVLIDSEYNAIPRTSTKIEVTNLIENNIKEIKNYNICEVEKIDLDGDKKYEYVVVMNESGNGDTKIILVNDNGEKVADLINIPNGYFRYATAPCYVEISDIMYIDFDNDNKMEILINSISWERTTDDINI